MSEILRVNPIACTGRGVCAELLPELITIDPWGYPIVPRADSGWYLVVPLIITGSGLGLLVSQLNNYTLAPISEERVSEAAGVNSAAGSFGLSFGLAFAGAIMLGGPGMCFECGHEHGVGDRCVAFHYDAPVWANIVAARGRSTVRKSAS